MTVGQLVADTLRLQYVLDCEHAAWARHNETEEKCLRCGVFATPRGKEYLLKQAARRAR